MSETTPETPVAAPVQQPLVLAEANPLANRLIAMHVDKLLFALVALLALVFAGLYTWLYFNHTW